MKEIFFLIMFVGSFANATAQLQIGDYTAVSGGGCDATVLSSRVSLIVLEFPSCMGMTITIQFDCRGKECRSRSDSSVRLTITDSKGFDLINSARIPAHYERSEMGRAN